MVGGTPVLAEIVYIWGNDRGYAYAWPGNIFGSSGAWWNYWEQYLYTDTILGGFPYPDTGGGRADTRWEKVWTDGSDPNAYYYARYRVPYWFWWGTFGYARIDLVVTSYVRDITGGHYETIDIILNAHRSGGAVWDETGEFVPWKNTIIDIDNGHKYQFGYKTVLDTYISEPAPPPPSMGLVGALIHAEWDTSRRVEINGKSTGGTSAPATELSSYEPYSKWDVPLGGYPDQDLLDSLPGVVYYAR